MGNIKFGFAHIDKPTPAALNRNVRIITVVLGIFLAWMNTNDIIPESAQHIINSIGGLVLGLINGLSPLFGIEVPKAKEIPVKDVTAMETKPL